MTVNSSKTGIGLVHVCVAGVLPSKRPFTESIHSSLPVAAVIPISQPPSPSTPVVSQGVNNFLIGKVGTLIPSSFCFHMKAHLLPESLMGQFLIVQMHGRLFSTFNPCLLHANWSPQLL